VIRSNEQIAEGRQLFISSPYQYTSTKSGAVQLGRANATVLFAGFCVDDPFVHRFT